MPASLVSRATSSHLTKPLVLPSPALLSAWRRDGLAASTSTAEGDDAALEALEAQWVKFGEVFMSWWSSTDDPTRRALLEVSAWMACNA